MIDLKLDEILNQPEDFRNFPIELFPEQISDFILELQNKNGCNPNFMAAAFLSVCGICIDRSKAIILKDLWEEWCVLWVVIVGEAGDKKSPSISPILKPLKLIQRNNYQKFERDQRNLTQDVTVELEPLKRIFTSDATIEQYINLHSQNKKGLAIIMGEIAALISNSGKYTGGKGSDIEKYLQAFSYEDLSSDRKVAKSSNLSNPHLNIFGGIQPNVLSSHMTTHLQDNGFWDRFLFVNGNKRSGYITLDPIDKKIENDYNSYVTGLYELINLSSTQIQDEDIYVDFYRLHGESLQCWFENHHKIELLTEPNSILDNRTKSAYSKMATYFGRFVLLFHILDTVYVYPFHSLKSTNAPIKVESVEKAFKLCKYFMFQYDLVAKEAVSKKESDNLLADTKGMSNKEKAFILKEKNPEWTDTEIAKKIGVSQPTISRYFKNPT